MEKVTVLVLGGGKSSRMGTDKAWLDLEGAPLIEHVARRLLPLAGEVLFSAAEDERFAPVIARLPVSARVVTDEYPGAGPLAGLHAGLNASRYDATVVVATDMPTVNLRLVQFMLDESPGYDAVVPLTPVQGQAEPQPEPLHAVYRQACLPAIVRALRDGRRRVISFLGDVRVKYLDPGTLAELDPGLTSFHNVNNPEEWAAAVARLHGERRDEA